MEELKPCPFCGSEAEYKTNKQYRGGIAATVGCKLCAAKVQQASGRGGTAGDAYRYAASQWNRRV